MKYIDIHRHSKIKFVTPSERHQGKDTKILIRRERLYNAAKLEKQNRWSGNTRNWSPVGAVALNPEHDEEIKNVAA